MIPIRPPKSVAPGRLWRLLIQKPRPRLPLTHRVAAAGDIQLDVVALRCPEEAGCFDAGELGTTRGTTAVSAALVAASVYSNGRKAFRDAADVMLLTSSEFDALVIATLEALDIVSPTKWRCDIDAWRQVLRTGAQDRRNLSEAVAMANCSDIIVASEVHLEPRPDRYYGMPQSDLTDGQRLAYSAAWGLVRDLRGKS